MMWHYKIHNSGLFIHQVISIITLVNAFSCPLYKSDTIIAIWTKLIHFKNMIHVLIHLLGYFSSIILDFVCLLQNRISILEF